MPENSKEQRRYEETIKELQGEISRLGDQVKQREQQGREGKMEEIKRKENMRSLEDELVNTGKIKDATIEGLITKVRSLEQQLEKQANQEVILLEMPLEVVYKVIEKEVHIV